MELQAKERGLAIPETTPPQGARGLYVHVPFCASKCRYCAFYKEAPRRADIERYLAALEREWAAFPLDTFDTCFFGGGTPGVLAPADFERLARFLRARGFAPREWTVELSPQTATPERLDALRRIGVTRLSMGVQSFDAATLKALGRRVPPARAFAAVEAIRAAGFDNVNLDLMIALPGQTPEALMRDLDMAVALAPAHLSTYCLTLEDDAPLFAALRAQGWQPDAERERACYLAAWERLPAAGYAHYEVSNFARAGRACIHNLNTWRMQNWLGSGPAAASQWGLARWANAANLEAWARGVETGAPARVDVRTLTPAELLADSLIFGLRMCAGVDTAALARRFGEGALSVYEPLWAALAKEGRLTREGDRVRLTNDGLMVADAVGLAVLECADGCAVAAAR